MTDPINVCSHIYKLIPTTRKKEAKWWKDKQTNVNRLRGKFEGESSRNYVVAWHVGVIFKIIVIQGSAIMRQASIGAILRPTCSVVITIVDVLNKV